MPGKMCTGGVESNAFNPRESKAYCEGMQHRTNGTAAAFPITDNPHDNDGSEAEVSWDAGWNFADAASPGAIDATGTCCNVTGVISA